MSTSYEARLLCVHPLCHRWPEARKTLRYHTAGETPAEALARIRAELAAAPRRRKCPECSRPVAVKHMTLWGTDGNGNHTGRVIPVARPVEDE